jgi:uncharacterized protein YndB with AHSA1/START domain
MAANNESKELVLTRVFDAPRELVFQAWTEPEHLKRWWGPNGFTLPYCTVDLRPGGAIHFCMRSPDGFEIWSKGIYREIVPPERFVSTNYFSDEQGNKLTPGHYGMPDWPTEMLMTVTFEEKDGKTTMTVRQVSATDVLPEAGKKDAERGWGESFDRLAAYVTSEVTR